MTGDWYHRAPCRSRCCLCGGDGCFVWHRDGDASEIHICAAGCDGLPAVIAAWMAAT